ncbi:uncharacterized protein LOC116348982 [Contarinia nasturtii]|uniref:uncharacterized protein LOC116348982 n=1 Tax=Contarinia nasturtii TaxID=265458 RepID=UPI0012D4BB78|nr:uncharacterized protein LOC116348982 [Contarinia nasturtii]
MNCVAKVVLFALIVFLSYQKCSGYGATPTRYDPKLNLRTASVHEIYKNAMLTEDESYRTRAGKALTNKLKGKTIKYMFGPRDELDDGGIPNTYHVSTETVLCEVLDLLDVKLDTVEVNWTSFTCQRDLGEAIEFFKSHGDRINNINGPDGESLSKKAPSLCKIL